MFDYVLILLVLIFGSISFYYFYDRFFMKTLKKDTSLYVEALKELLDGREEAAFSKLRQEVMENPNNIDAYLRLGQILRNNNKPERALQVHKDLTLRSDLARQEKIEILHQLASDYVALNEFKTAAEALEELISLDPQNHWAYTQLLKIQEKTRRWDDAYETAVHILKLESNKSKKPLALYKFYKGEELFKKRDYHKARILLKEAIGLDPTFVPAYLVVGDSYYEEKRVEDAVNFWNKLVSIVPDQAHQVIERLKKALFELGRFGNIIEICSNILDNSPKNIEARRTLAEFYEKKGDPDQACEYLEQIIEDFPDDYPTIIELTRIYLDKGDRKKIDELFRTLERRREKHKETITDKSVKSPSV
ncbi:MAG: tetratricopeptide repeat protein [candidate division Zixibacteria bacterium]|nr:tetratricopeptide repeat protein [candidate division Zixibacteria bacterium]MDD5426492.1 tetratricopeptide repeat protein [candidate division Zixibacteria bacterium]